MIKNFKKINTQIVYFGVFFTSQINKIRLINRKIGLNIHDKQINDEIKIKGEVKMLSEDSKDLGIMPFYKAAQISQDFGKDLVLQNSKAKPPVCQIMSYQDYLEQQFIKFLSVKDPNLLRIQQNKGIKTIKLSYNIQQNDLITKIEQAERLSAKFGQIKIVIVCGGEQIDKSRNIHLTFQEETADFLRPDGQISITSMGQLERDETEQFTLEQVFKNILYSKVPQAYSQEEIQHLVDFYFKRYQNSSKFVPIQDDQEVDSQQVQEMPKMSKKRQKNQKYQDIFDQVDEYKARYEEQKEDYYQSEEYKMMQIEQITSLNESMANLTLPLQEREKEVQSLEHELGKQTDEVKQKSMKNILKKKKESIEIIKKQQKLIDYSGRF